MRNLKSGITSVLAQNDETDESGDALSGSVEIGRRWTMRYS